jgi:hypothetical protein
VLYAVLVLVFSFGVLALSLFANIELSAGGSAGPLRSIYATLLTLVGILGVFVGIALMVLHRRLARLEIASRKSAQLSVHI